MYDNKKKLLHMGDTQHTSGKMRGTGPLQEHPPVRIQMLMRVIANGDCEGLQ